MAVRRKYTTALTSSVNRLAPLLFDDFSRADGSLEGTVCPTGQMWTGAGSLATISSGKVIPRIASFAVPYPMINVGQADYTVQVTVATLDTSSFMQIVPRYCGYTDNLHLQIAGTTSYVLEKKIGNSGTTVATIAVNPTVNDVLKIQLVGTTVTVWINGTQQFTGTVTGISTTSPLLALAYAGTTGAFDNLLVTPN